MAAEVISLIDLLPANGVGASDYSRAITPEILNEYAELGLSSEIMPIFARHMADLYLRIDLGREDTLLHVGAVKEPGEDAIQEWRRYINVSERQLSRYTGALESVFEGQGVRDDTIAQVAGLALRWVYFEASAAVLSNSCYMQSRFDKYIRDYNGNSPHYRSDLTLSRRYLTDQLGGDEPDIHLLENDAASFRGGIGLMFLKNALLSAGVVSSIKRAEWLVGGISELYPHLNPGANPVVPMDEYDILARMAHSEPEQGVIFSYQRYASMIDVVDDDIE